MILIVERGSTKADFVFLNMYGTEVLSLQTIGLNPLFLNSEQIEYHLKSNVAMMDIKDEVKNIKFFGAGCRSVELNSIVKNAFRKVFQNADCEVESDLMAACLSISYQRKSLIGILGTGSNSCYFDGTNIIKNTPSLGFILGDEGSGNQIGKELIKMYFADLMPIDLSKTFENKYHFSVDQILENVYQKPHANAFLARLSEFAFEHKDHEFIKELLRKCFISFFETQIRPYQNMNTNEIGFVGSIAFLFRDILCEIAQKFGYSVHKIVQQPMHNLVEIYKNQIKSQKP